MCAVPAPRRTIEPAGSLTPASAPSQLTPVCPDGISSRATWKKELTPLLSKQRVHLAEHTRVNFPERYSLMRDLVETRFDISLNHPCEATSHELLTAENGMVRVAIGPKPVRMFVELNLKDRFESHSHGFLHDLVAKARDIPG